MNTMDAVILSLTEAQNARVEIEQQFVKLRDEHEKAVKEIAELREQLASLGQHRSGEGGDQEAP